MVKILLIIENFKELTQMSNLLKKVGCDVDSMSKEVGLNEKILSFRPEIVITSSSNQKIDFEKLSSRIRSLPVFSGKIILMFTADKKNNASNLKEGIFDGMLEHPYDPLHLINIIVQLSGAKKTELAEKFQKFLIQGSLGIDPQKIIKTQDGKSLKVDGELENVTNLFLTPAQEKAKNEKYSKMVANVKIGPTTINKADTQKRIKELQKGWDRKFLDEIDAEKKDVVKRLFKKAK